MSLYGALFSGVSGLQSQSSAMGAIADNVTNVNTSGYKGTKVNFQTLITKQASLSKYSAGGVQSKPRQGVDIQGLLQSTNSSTDVGISGDGFFVVNEQPNPVAGNIFAYTRAGSFKVDKAGYLQNVGGWYMQGWPLQNWDGTSSAAQVTVGNDTYMKSYKNDSGTTVYINDNIVDSTNVKPMNLNTIGGTAVATTTVSFGANLPSSADIGNTEQANILIYDSLGNAHNLDYTWAKAASNSWNVEVVPPEGSATLTLKDQAGDNYMAMGRLDFDYVPAAGSAMTMVIGTSTYTFNFAAAADATAAPTFNINTAGTTLSQMIDVLTTCIDNALTAKFGAVPSWPGQWAERISGTDSIIFRQGSSVGGDTITVDADGIVDSSANICTMQGREYSGSSFSVPVLDAAISWVTAGQHAVEFNGDGTPKYFFEKDATTEDDPRCTINIDWVNGSEDMDGTTSSELSQFLGNYNLADGLTQFAGNYQINYISQNGSKFGNFAGVSIGADGIVTALFDNGVTRPVYMIPLATFVNPNGMESLTGNVWIETDFSGQPTVREAGDAGAGTVNAATLESSTVDLGEEFTAMITTQRAYSAAAKIITTTDQMLDELVNIKR